MAHESEALRVSCLELIASSPRATEAPGVLELKVRSVMQKKRGGGKNGKERATEAPGVLELKVRLAMGKRGEDKNRKEKEKERQRTQ